MSDMPVILLVEDDDFSSMVTTEMLSSDYQVHHVESGRAALEFLGKQIPDMVLLDVSMEGLTGYDVCREIRSDSKFDGLPVLFLSGMVSEQERLAGYEAGGDDYLTKPVAIGELQHKVELALKNYAERRRLKEDLAGSFSTAMTAMTTAADMGNVLQYLQASYRCDDYRALCQLMLDALRSAGYEASVQIRGLSGQISLGPNGACSALEESVLSNMSAQGRLFEFSSCLSCTYEHITVIVKQLNRADPEAHGRLRDNLALIVEGSEARIVALDAAAKLEKEHQALTQLIASTKDTLKDIDSRQKEQRLNSKKIFEDLQSKFEGRLLTIGITVSQEEELAELIQEATNRALALYDAGVSTDSYMEKILRQLDRGVGSPAHI